MPLPYQFQSAALLKREDSRIHSLIVREFSFFNVFVCLCCFPAVVQRLLSNKELAGDLQGRQDKAVYIPHVYVRNQNNWVDSFLGNNGYLGN
jgi:hypothetical protein